jgi:DNA-binding MarR family transcriptional regulator
MPSMPSTDPVRNPLARLTLETGGGDHLTGANLVGDLHALFFLPGDLFIWALTTYAAPLAGLLGIAPSDYGGVLSGFVSSCAWIAAFVALAIAWQAILDFDRRVTSAAQRLYSTVMLRARIARILTRQRVRAWLAWRKPANRTELASDIEISPAQLQALRLHAELAPGYVLPVSEAAAATGTRLHAMQDLLDGLQRLGLLERRLGAADDESAYTLTKAGMALLVFRKLDPGTSAAPATRRATRNI